MALVVFLRAANVGGHNVFKPSALAAELADLDVVNIGAAGTFVVRKRVGAKALRSAIVGALGFEPEVIVRPGNEILDLARSQALDAQPVVKEAKRFVSVLTKRPFTLPSMPIERPEGRAWLVKIVDVRGHYALSLQRSGGSRALYPNEVVEKTLGVAATTRGWATIEAIGRTLRGTS